MAQYVGLTQYNCAKCLAGLLWMEQVPVPTVLSSLTGIVRFELVIEEKNKAHPELPSVPSRLVHSEKE